MKPARARHAQCPAILAVVLLLSACATVPERSTSERSYCQGTRPGGAAADACVEDARRPYWDFILRKNQALRQSGGSEEDAPPGWQGALPGSAQGRRGDAAGTR